MALLELLRGNTALYLGLAGMFGLIVGSFLNVVIARLPVMMRRGWEKECRESLGLEVPATAEAPVSLVSPGSRCPHCGHAIRAHENIPLLSYLLLRGRCSACHGRVSLQYPLVELLGGLVAVAAAWHYGLAWPALAAAAFGFALIALAGIDFRTQFLPDSITLPLLWAGLIVNLGGLFTDLKSAVLGAVAGYLILWLIFHIFKRLTGKEGMGYGDFKLLAALGAWAGWQALPLVLLLSSLIGAVVGIALITLRRLGRDIPMPFGPYLAAAGWVGLLFGGELNTAYLNLLLGQG